MNCMEFRRLALANPQHPGQPALEHEAVCPDCARFYLALRQREEDLYQALSIPVPDGLADRVLLRTGRPRLLDRLTSVGVWLPALAAALVLALGLGLGLNVMIPSDMSTETLAASVIDHVRREPAALAAEQQVPMVKLASAFARSGGDLVDGTGQATIQASYAGRCPLPGGGHGEHIVLKTPHGKVTLVLMPGKPVAAALRMFKDGYAISLLPAGEGSLALVAESDALVRQVEANLGRGVRWRGTRT